MRKNKSTKFYHKVLAVLTIFLVGVLLVLQYSDSGFSMNDFFQKEEYYKYIQEGIINTLIVSLLALILSVILGFLLYVMSESRYGYFRSLSNTITEIMLGTPLLVLIILGVYFISPALNASDLFGDQTKMFVGIIIISCYIAPYMSNVYKGAMSSIDDDQFVVMELYGFSFVDRYRYIIIPQLVKQLMPPLINNLSLIIKSSALLNVVGFHELFYSITLVQSKTYAFVEGYILMWALYLVITIPLSQLAKYVERSVAK